jgi:glycosyltransferase involved in cell wall biosynthesis
MYVIGDLRLGGAEKLVSRLASGLHDRTCFSSSVCCLGEGGEYAKWLTEQGYTVHILGYRKQLGVKGLVTAIRLIRELRSLFVREQVDIVHTYLFYTGILGRFAARLAGVPVVVHSLFRLFYRVQPLIERIFSGITSQFVVDSYAVQELVSMRCGISKDHIRVIYDGIDFAALDSEELHDVREELGLQEARYVVGIVAHLNAAKGHALYLQAFTRVLEEFPGTWLLIVGDGPLRQQLEAACDALNIGHRVLFLGYRSDIASVLTSLDILVLPSTWEGFGIVQAEAMYLGVPVVGTNNGGAREVVRAFRTGLLVPYGDIDQLADATVLLLQDDSLRNRMGCAGRDRVLRLFGMDRLVNVYESLYLELFENRNSGRAVAR